METIVTKNDINQDYYGLKNKFKSMLKGSNTAKYLSIAYAVASFVFAFKFKDQLLYCLPLVFSGFVVFLYAVKFLWLKDINTKASTVNELISAIKEYKKQTLKRERYESYVMVFWLLTLIPVYLEGKSITPFMVMLIVGVFYIFTHFGHVMFNKAKEQLKQMDSLIAKIN